MTRPGVYAQCVGFPDPVNYRSKAATTMDKYIEDYTDDARGPAMRRLLEPGTDTLSLVVEVWHQRGVPVVAGFRMNSEDFGDNQLNLYDFGRAHRNWTIPGTNCLDPAIPEVYEHRTAIFREVAENLVDYLAPAMFHGTFDRTKYDGKERTLVDIAAFTGLVRDKPIGIYPTLWYYSPKAEEGEPQALRAYRDAAYVLPDWFCLPWDNQKRWKE